MSHIAWVRGREVVVEKELLGRPAAVCRAALLVGRDLFAAQVFEGALPVGQVLTPFFGGSGGLRLHWGMLSRPSSWSATPLQSHLMERVAPLIRDPHHCRVVDEAALLVVCPERLQRARDAPASIRCSAGRFHPLLVAPDALVSFCRVSPGWRPRLGGREAARQRGGEATADERHGTEELRQGRKAC